MKVFTELDLFTFKFWAGGENNAELLTRDELEKVQETLEEIYPDGIDATNLNDIFWFDFETVCDWLGLDIDEVLERDE